MLQLVERETLSGDFIARGSLQMSNSLRLEEEMASLLGVLVFGLEMPVGQRKSTEADVPPAIEVGARQIQKKKRIAEVT